MCSEHGVLIAFLFGNLLRATTACTFSTSQLPKVPETPTCFYQFDFEICFVPQWRAIFQQLNFQKCFRHEVFLAFWPLNLFRTAAACNFWSLIWWDSCAPAALASLLFQPSRATLEKHSASRLLFLFDHLFFLLILSLLWSSFFFFLTLLWLFPPLLSHLFILSEVWLLSFLRVFIYICVYIHLDSYTVCCSYI